MALDKITLAALRQADSVVFRHGARGNVIEAIKETRASERQPFAGEAKHEFPVKSNVSDYERAPGQFECFHMIQTAQYSNAWRTIVDLLRVDDEVSLSWCGANDNDYLRDAGLHFDELRLVVWRGKKCWTLTVGSSVCPDNTARMIRAY